MWVMSDVLSATLQLAPGARPGVTIAQVAAAAAGWRGEDTRTLPAAAHTTGERKEKLKTIGGCTLAGCVAMFSVEHLQCLCRYLDI